MKKKVEPKKDKKGQTPTSGLTSIPSTIGQRAADTITKWAGSWTFILSFIVLLILWMVANTSWMLFQDIWDPFPAFQAPIILMSQNRTNERDRQRAEYDYAVNRRAEREIQLIKKQINRIEKYLHK